MDQGLQKFNADQRLFVWTQWIDERRSSGANMKSWCREKACQTILIQNSSQVYQDML